MFAVLVTVKLGFPIGQRTIIPSVVEGVKKKLMLSYPPSPSSLKSRLKTLVFPAGRFNFDIILKIMGKNKTATVLCFVLRNLPEIDLFVVLQQ